MTPAIVGESRPKQCEFTLTDQDGKAINPRLDLRNHSPTGLSWGYAGSGPAQCALAILAHFYSDHTALRFYQQFKAEVIAIQPDNFILTKAGVDKWVRSQIDGRDPDPTREGIFQNHNCWKCNDGEKPCVTRGGPNQCEYPHARND